MARHSYMQIDSIANLPGPDENGFISHYVFQYIDFNEVPQYIAAGHKWHDCFFLGCAIPKEMQESLDPTNLQFPRLGLPYSTFRGSLYTAEELYEGFDPDKPQTFETCRDSLIYNHFMEKGKQCKEIRETLGRSLHDRGIEDTMADFLSHYGETQVVAIMGGHALKRTDPEYRKIALISKDLTEKGKLMASGGGPGAMEATHLGAWMAGRTDEEMEEAFAMLEPSPTFRDEGWLASAFKVRERFPQKRFRSLGIPTWFYGHEPSTPLATDIAKYFQNSMREDILLTIAKGGIIYSPGSAGTLQEIFQDAAQNHYKTVGLSSPMVFLGKEFWGKEIPVYEMLETLMASGRYQNLLLTLTDEREEAVQAIMSFKG
ncbi:MAG: LOG family protein [Bacteroidales bacterium]|nr:LOG family protein [Bacteroidales bacterium]